MIQIEFWIIKHHKLKLIKINHFTAIWQNPPSGNIQTQEKDTKSVVVRLIIPFESLF